MLVDDDATLLETVAAILSDFCSEFVVSTASSGEEALRLLDAHPANVVVSDFHMPPGITGVELLRTARGRALTDCGVLVTGLRDQMPKGSGRDDAVFAVVYKPYDPGALVQTIREAVRIHRMTTAANHFASRVRAGRAGRSER